MYPQIKKILTLRWIIKVMIKKHRNPIPGNIVTLLTVDYVNNFSSRWLVLPTKALMVMATSVRLRERGPEAAWKRGMLSSPASRSSEDFVTLPLLTRWHKIHGLAFSETDAQVLTEFNQITWFTFVRRNTEGNIRGNRRNSKSCLSCFLYQKAWWAYKILFLMWLKEFRNKASGCTTGKDNTGPTHTQHLPLQERNPQPKPVPLPRSEVSPAMSTAGSSQRNKSGT